MRVNNYPFGIYCTGGEPVGMKTKSEKHKWTFPVRFRTGTYSWKTYLIDRAGLKY